MKGAVVLDLEPLTVIEAGPPVAAPVKAAAEKPEAPKADAKPAVAIVTPIPTALAAVEPQVQKRRDNDRRRILEDELAKEEDSLSGVRNSLAQEQLNPQLAAAVRAAQAAADPTPTQMVEFRNNIDKASGRIRGLQATAAEHEKNIEALKKELGALKP
jgi:chromosome segregation ATPase